MHDDCVPDSGYASAEEDDDNDDEEEYILLAPNDGDGGDVRDPYERTFAIKWLTGFIARSDSWVLASKRFNDQEDQDEEERYQIMDEITSLLSAFAAPENERSEPTLTRRFSFSLAVVDTNTESDCDRYKKRGEEKVVVQLNDAPISNEDHTSVGLQSWASSIVLAERMCAAPARFGFGAVCLGGKPRILELGAGTGLLSIVAAKLLCGSGNSTDAEVIATDYHPAVLRNLVSNIDTNFPTSSPSSPCPINAHPLNWSHPLYPPPLDKPFGVVLAADVIYHAEHAGWVKGCVESVLLRPTGRGRGGSAYGGGAVGGGGVFWLIIPLRSTGRHEGMWRSVDAVFPDVGAFRTSVERNAGGREDAGEWKLAVLEREEVTKREGLGRADEGGYRLFKIGWVWGLG